MKEINNKEKILKWSLKLFSSRGYEAVGIQEIVDRSEITKPTLYHYFGSKKGLLNELINLYGNNFSIKISEAAVYNHDIVNNLNKLAFAFINFALENKEFYRMQLAMYFSPPESESNKSVLQMNLKIYKLIEELFEKASNDHGNMKGRHKTYAATFIGMINTYIGLILNKYIELNDDMIYKAVKQFMHGIFS